MNGTSPGTVFIKVQGFVCDQHREVAESCTKHCTVLAFGGGSDVKPHTLIVGTAAIRVTG